MGKSYHSIFVSLQNVHKRESWNVEDGAVEVMWTALFKQAWQIWLLCCGWLLGSQYLWSKDALPFSLRWCMCIEMALLLHPSTTCLTQARANTVPTVGYWWLTQGGYLKGKPFFPGTLYSVPQESLLTVSSQWDEKQKKKWWESREHRLDTV